MISLDALPSASAGSASTDSTGLGWKTSGGKIPDSSKRHSLNLLHTNNYLQSTHDIFTTIYVSFTLC